MFSPANAPGDSRDGSHGTPWFLNGLPRKLFRSRFFTISVLLHFILVLVFGGSEIVRQYDQPVLKDFTVDMEAEPDRPLAALPPKVETPLPAVLAPSPDTLAKPPAPPEAAIADLMHPTHPAIVFDGPGLLQPGNFDRPTPTSFPQPPPGTSLTEAQKAEIGKFAKWDKPGSSSGPGTPLGQRRFEFTAYLAKYGDPRNPDRAGDWASTHFVKEGKIVKGSLPNLLYVMNKTSREKIDASLDETPLDLSSDQIFAKRPPFIFFTGHRDFVLTQREVENLRNYIRVGGCLWGDSSLPGRRSRFDIAFRREMRRIIPDTDKEWERLPSSHPMFTKALYKEARETPAGMNHYQEPVYALKFAGEVAILYTANDYADMWQYSLDTKGQFDLSTDEKGSYVVMNKQLWDWKGTYYRNVDPVSVLNSYKFGANVVVHLLTRWEDRLKNIPAGL